MKLIASILAAAALMIPMSHQAAAGTTNDYTFTPPGLTHINPLWPLPTENMSDSGAQSIVQLKKALLDWALAEHNPDGTHKMGFVNSAMIPPGAITRQHFESNVTFQAFFGSNGVAQLPLSDVFVQWVWVPADYMTSSCWSVSWPLPFSNGVWWADAGTLTLDPSYNNAGGHYSTNEWAFARVHGWTLSNVFGSVNISGIWTPQFTNKVCVIGIGR